LAKKKYFRFTTPTIRCGCPRMTVDDKKGKLFRDCTCVIQSGISRRERFLAPRGKYVLFVTSNKDPKLTGWEPFDRSIKLRRP